MNIKPDHGKFKLRLKRLFRLFCLSVFGFCILISYSSLSCAQTNEKKNVLILHSYHIGFKWSDDITKGIVSVLETEKKGINIFIEYMDTKRIFDEQYFQQLYEIYKHKFEKLTFDVVICSDDNAFNLLKKHRDEVFPGTPVVFCGVNYFKEADLAGYDLFTGVNEEADIKSGIEIALKLHPNTKQIFVINDCTTTGLKLHEELMKIIPDYQDTVKFTLLEDIEMTTIQEKLRDLPTDSLVFYTLFFRDKTGKFFEYDESISLIAANCNVPIYGTWDFSLGYGILGGMLTSGYYQGETAAKMALRILQGEKVGNIPVIKESPNRYIFDYRQLNRFDIKLSSLPEDSLVINKPRSLYSEYKELVWGVIASMAGLSFIIFILSLNILKRRRAEQMLSESERKLYTLMSNLPGMAYRCLNDRDWTMEFVSEGCLELTGYRPSDLEQSRTISYKDLIRPEYQEEVWNKVQSALKTRTPFRLEYRIVTADGTKKWVLEQGRGVFSPQEELLALEGFITDISERKLAEQALRERQARERDINIASKIQTTLLLGQPPRDIQGIRVAQLTIASQKVDGDFFDFIKLKSQCFDLVVGDVMGKGIAAALLGAAMKSHILRVLNEQIRISGKKDILPDPEDIISNVHSCMIDQLVDIETFVTLCYARFDLEKRLFSFVDCGHMRTIHFQDDSNSCSLLQGVNMPLGFPKQESFSQISLPFRPGDFFFFYSDGLTESKNQDGFLYGEKSLVDFVQANAGLEPEDLIKSVWRDVVAFSQSEVFDDDFTCVLVKINKESSKPVLSSEVELEIKSNLKELVRVRPEP